MASTQRWYAPILILAFVITLPSFILVSKSISNQEDQGEIPLSVLDQEVRKREEAFKKDPTEKGRQELVLAYQAMSARLTKENLLNEALKYLEWADELDVSQASTGSVDGYMRLGLASLEGGDFYAAEKNFDLAVSKGASEAQRKSIATVLHNVGVGILQKQGEAAAEKFFSLSTRYYDGIQNTWDVLGDIAYNTQRLKEAERHWRKAMAIKEDANINIKLDKLKREAGVEMDMAQYGASHFIIRYKRSDQAYQGYQLKQVLNEAYSTISRDFNYYPDGMIPVILYDSAEFRQVTETPHWSAGLYDGKIRLPVFEEGKMNETEFGRLTYHELTHAFVYDLAGQSCPVWLNEGLAQVEEDKARKINTVIFDQAKKSGLIYSFFQMESGLANLKSEDAVGLFYQQAFLMTKFLVDRYRVYRMVEILKQLKTGTLFEDALRKSTGLTMKQFEQKWSDSL